MQYDSALALVQGRSLNTSTIESRFVTKPKSSNLRNDHIYSSVHSAQATRSAQEESLSPPLSPVIHHPPSLSRPEVFSAIYSARVNNMLQALAVKPPLPQRVQVGQGLISAENFVTMPSSSLTQIMAPISLVSPSPTGSTVSTDFTIKPSRPTLLLPAPIAAHPSHEHVLLPVNTSLSQRFTDNNSDEVPSNVSSPLSSPPRSPSSTPLTLSPSVHVVLAEESVRDKENDPPPTCSPDDPDTIMRFSGDNSDRSPTNQASNTKKSRAQTKRRRSASPILLGKLGSEENPIDVDKVASLFEPVFVKEYVYTFIFLYVCTDNILQRNAESISLETATNSPVKGNRSYTVFDVNGEPVSFTPSFHVSCKISISQWIIELLSSLRSIMND